MEHQWPRHSSPPKSPINASPLLVVSYILSPLLGLLIITTRSPLRLTKRRFGLFTEEELKSYDGSDPKKSLLMAVKARICDVSQRRS
ncbi:hypothetical protein U1Q18_015290 [Sarracenia purpurea var. burkii]